MEKISIYSASISELGDAIGAGKVTAEEVVQCFLDRINAFDQRGPKLNAIVFVNPKALEEARSLDKEREEKGPRGPLHGIPIVLKDNIDVAHWPTYGGSLALHGLIPQHDAEVVKRLREAGALMLAKTSLHELAAGIMTVSSHHGRTRNPYDLTRHPGGSSGGTSAAIAARFACIGLGTDTCGSIRYPAAHCCLVGLRVTQGRTPMKGILPMCPTQDVVGPIARSIPDLVKVLNVIVEQPLYGRFTHGVLYNGTFEGKNVGRLVTLFSGEHADPEVLEVVNSALDRFAILNAKVVDIELPQIVPLLDKDFIIPAGDLPVHIESYLRERPNSPVKTLKEILDTGKIHAEVEPNIKISCSSNIAETDKYREAIQSCERLQSLLVSAMNESKLACLAYPTNLQSAVPLGDSQPQGNANVSANSGLPAISVPVGFTKDGMPVGLELLGRPDSDIELVEMAYVLEKQYGIWPLPNTTPNLSNNSSS